MIPCDRTFNGENTYEENGITYYRWYFLELTGDYDLDFRFVSTNSIFPQGISLFCTKDFKGKLFLDDSQLPPLKSIFAHINLKEHEFPTKQFTLSVRSTSGGIYLANTSGDIWDCGVFGYALWVEQLADNHYRFHCNDAELDDDFDDLIFDIIVTMK